MKNFNSCLFLALTLLSGSCIENESMSLKEDDLTLSEDVDKGALLTLISPDSVNGLANAKRLPSGKAEVFAVSGGYKANWGGEIKFSNIIYPSPFLEGQQVADLEIDCSDCLSIYTFHGYFIIEKPTYVGGVSASAIDINEVQEFREALNQYFSGETDANGTPLMPNVPLMGEYISFDNGSGIITTKGQVVMTNFYASKMAVVSENYLPEPAPVADPFIIGYFINAGETYWIYANTPPNVPVNTVGNISKLGKYDSATGDVEFVAVDGSYKRVVSGWEVDLTAYLNSTTAIQFEGVVDGL